MLFQTWKWWFDLVRDLYIALQVRSGDSLENRLHIKKIILLSFNFIVCGLFIIPFPLTT